MKVIVEIKTGRKEVLSNGMSICEIQVPEANLRQYLYLPFDDYHRYFGAPEGIEGDLLIVAGSCYLIDQLIKRSLFSDQWTRDLEVSIQVEDAHRWEHVSNILAQMLCFLTGDRWQFSFTSRQTRIYRNRHKLLRKLALRPASIVCLFSGGVDSLAGAIDVLTQTHQTVTLVGHYDGTGATLQQKLAQKLNEQFPGRVNFIQNRVGAVSTASLGNSGLSATEENTLRSRSFIFLALAVYVAQHSKRNVSLPILIPENGFIAANPPLTHSRLGSFSTRTAHPLYMEQVQSLLSQLGIQTPISNPLCDRTKGEVLSLSSNQELLLSLVPETVSCAHPHRRQGWNRVNASNCGYCVPCIFRRAAFHRVGIDEGNLYGIDAFGGELAIDSDLAVDIRAVLNFVHDIEFGEIMPESLVKRMPLPLERQAVFAHILQAGAEEVIQLVYDKAVSRVKKWSGLA